MSKLQNNFTTPEQSKRLLELGVPAWTADCFITLRGAIKARQSMCLSKDFFLGEPNYAPCWSVGRLIEILEIILGSPWSDKELLGKQETLLERVLSDFEDVVKYKEIFKDNRIDFSKLEEV